MYIRGIIDFGSLTINLGYLLSIVWGLFQKDLSPLVKQLAPGKDDNGAQIPCVTCYLFILFFNFPECQHDLIQQSSS